MPTNIVIPDEAKQAQSIVEDVLGESIVGIYLFGSAVVGGLKRNSDVDILVVVNNPPIQNHKKALVAQLMKVSGAIGNVSYRKPIELTVITVSDVVPWRFPPRAEFVYGEWLREEFEAGGVPDPANDPDLTIVLKKVIDNSLPLYGTSAAEVFESVPMADIKRAIHDSLPALLADTAGDERNVILTLSRMWMTAVMGEIASKDVAAEWAKGQLAKEHAALLDYAKQGYLGNVEDRWEGKQVEFKMLTCCLRKSIEACLGS